MQAKQCILLLCIWIFAALGCQGDPDVRETIRELRILGIQAEPPEAKPGAEIKFDVLAAIVPSATISYRWYLCTEPDKAADGCHLDGAKAVSQESKPTIKIPATYLDGITAPLVALRGRYLFVTLVAKAGEQEVVATKRVVVSSAPSNQNPSLDPLKVYKADGKTQQASPFAAKSKDEIKLQPTPADGASQRYEIIAPDGKKTSTQERLYYSWYTTAGTYAKGYLTQSSAPDNTFQVPEEKPKDPMVTLYLVLRDGRGGITWQSTQVEIK